MYNLIHMSRTELFLCTIVVLIVIWIYYMQFYHISTECKIFVDDLCNYNVLKTGDLILFKAYDNFRSVFHGSYFGHIGMVYIYNEIPMLFEANGVDATPLKPHHSKLGMYLTPLEERIKKYKGTCFLKPLSTPLPSTLIEDFKYFIDYAMNNFKYDYNIVSGSVKRWLGLAKCNTNTDCGQLVFLCLMKLKLLAPEEYDIPRLHYLKYVCEISNLQYGYKYLPLVEIIDHPFAF